MVKVKQLFISNCKKMEGNLKTSAFKSGHVTCTLDAFTGILLVGWQDFQILNYIDPAGHTKNTFMKGINN